MNLMTKPGQVMIYRAFFFPAFLLLALLMLVMPQSGLAGNAGTQLPHLRIIYGKEQALANGTVILPLEILLENVCGSNCPVSLSDVTVGVASLPALDPLIKQTKKQIEPLVYQSIPVIKTGGKWMIQLASGTPRNFAIRVQAQGMANGKKTYFVAETNCSIFGRKLGMKDETRKEALPPAWFSGLGMSIYPPFYYWPQTETPLQVTLHFGNRVLPKKALTVFDESLPPEYFLTDDSGRVVYTPPNDPVLNRKSEKASKQVFLVAFHSEGDNLFVVTRTLRLHRNRYSHLQPHMGMALFGTTALVTGGMVLWVRRRRRPA